MAQSGSSDEFFDGKEVNCEMRGKAYRICRDYLHGAWKQIEAKDMVIKHISGGLSNHLYYCALPACTPTANEPSEVLVRFYGQVHGEEALESLLAESVIFTLLSERRLGPRLYGVFPGGRIEQYIPARSMKTHELANPRYSRVIAMKMARIHSLSVPISKEPTWMWRTMERWLNSSQEFLQKSPASSLSASSAKALEKLQRFPYRDELERLRRIVTRINSPVVFAHNDMQEGNILTNSKAGKLSDRISLIDFEYCSYNYRGFDIANHFCEWVYCYKLPTEPYFTVTPDAFPSRDQQLNFIRSYLHHYESSCGRKYCSSSSHENGHHQSKGKSSSCSSNGSQERDDEDEEAPRGPHPSEERLLKEVEVFIPASHLFWALWSIIQGHVSQIPFGYLEYALVRMEHYYNCKKILNDSDSDIVDIDVKEK